MLRSALGRSTCLHRSIATRRYVSTKQIPSRPAVPPLKTSIPRHVRIDTPPAVGVTAGVEEAKKDILKAQEQGVLVPPPADASRIGKLYHQAKQLFKFYWNGLKRINTHRLQVALIRERIKNGGSPLTRAEYRFIRTYNQDALKLIPFLLIVVTLEELIPIIAIYAPFMLPSTTIFPSQLKRIEEKAHAKQLRWALERQAFARVAKEGIRQAGGHKPLAGILRLPTWGPAPLVLSRIDTHLRFIARDDELLAREGMGETLTEDEVRRTLAERGIITTQDEGRKQLAAWLATVGVEEEEAVSRRILAVARANTQ